ncbi:hypothetical protein F2P81_019716 [Scophthalmus maximus]|uniref:Uncharacterized protein n=1 Tax=Scophthalmus maximus TaxID=52904 RepID=A0A6A4S7V9_SCOMX|nr:hypothetical protein F2P81_019716 [Scophthalmus maximus]
MNIFTCDISSFSPDEEFSGGARENCWTNTTFQGSPEPLTGVSCPRALCSYIGTLDKRDVDISLVQHEGIEGEVHPESSSAVLPLLPGLVQQQRPSSSSSSAAPDTRLMVPGSVRSVGRSVGPAAEVRLYIVCSVLVHRVFSTCTSCVQYLYIVCSVLVHRVFSTCTSCVQYLYIVCSVLVHPPPSRHHVELSRCVRLLHLYRTGSGPEADPGRNRVWTGTRTGSEPGLDRKHARVWIGSRTGSGPEAGPGLDRVWTGSRTGSGPEAGPEAGAGRDREEDRKQERVGTGSRTGSGPEAGPEAGAGRDGEQELRLHQRSHDACRDA